MNFFEMDVVEKGGQLHERRVRDTEELTLGDFPYINETRNERFYFYYRANIAFYSIFLIILIVGVIANGVVIYLVFRHRQLRTSINYFITNLAAADLILLIVLIVLRGVDFLTWGQLLTGEVSFLAISFTLHVCIQATASILACMSFSRYLLISSPMKARVEWTPKRVWIVCAVCWIGSMILFLPLLFGILRKPPDVDVYIYPLGRKVFAIYRLTVMFIIPLIVIVTCYYRILVIFRSGKFVEESKQSSNVLDRARVESQIKKLTRMVFIVILVFFFSWGPTQIDQICKELRYHNISPTLLRWKVNLMFSFFLRLFAYVGSTLNPFIYAYTNPSFQKVGMFRRQKKRTQSTSTTTSTLATQSHINSHL